MTDFQDAPIQDGSDDATRRQKLDGIAVQVRADLELGHADDAAALLRERLADAALTVSDDEFDHLLAGIR